MTIPNKTTDLELDNISIDFKELLITCLKIVPPQGLTSEEQQERLTLLEQIYPATTEIEIRADLLPRLRYWYLQTKWKIQDPSIIELGELLKTL